VFEDVTLYYKNFFFHLQERSMIDTEHCYIACGVLTLGITSNLFDCSVDICSYWTVSIYNASTELAKTSRDRLAVSSK